MSDTTSVLSYIGVALGLGSTLFTAINHRRVRSTCCGVTTVSSLDVESTTPPSLKISSIPVDVEACNPNVQPKPVDCKENSKVSQ
jgi:hypothetical protein